MAVIGLDLAAARAEGDERVLLQQLLQLLFYQTDSLRWGGFTINASNTREHLAAVEAGLRDFKKIWNEPRNLIQALLQTL